MQHIFALTVDVDGLPGGPLWVSSNRGESFADVSPAIQQAMPQGAPSLTGVMDVHWHEKQPGRVLFQGKVRRQAWVLVGGCSGHGCCCKGDEGCRRCRRHPLVPLLLRRPDLRSQQGVLAAVLLSSGLCLPPPRLLPARQGRYHFVSSDYGTTFKALATPGDTAGFGHEIRLHPRQPDWLLAKVQRNECILDRRRCGGAPGAAQRARLAGGWVRPSCDTPRSAESNSCPLSHTHGCVSLCPAAPAPAARSAPTTCSCPRTLRPAGPT